MLNCICLAVLEMRGLRDPCETGCRANYRSPIFAGLRVFEPFASPRTTKTTSCPTIPSNSPKMTSSSSSLSAAPPSPPPPHLLRSAAASSSSSLSSLFQFSPSDTDTFSLPSSDELRAHQAVIAQAFGPTIAVVASRDVEELARVKGFPGGLVEMLRPFGDVVAGKVNIRDSQALTVSVEDFSVKYVDFHYYAQSVMNGREKGEQDGP